mgnify:CR=1 FL=1
MPGKREQEPERGEGLTMPLKLIAGFVALMLVVVVAMIVMRLVDRGPNFSKASYVPVTASAITWLGGYDASPRSSTLPGKPLAASLDGSVLLVESDSGRVVSGIDVRTGMQKYTITDINCSGVASSTLRTGIVDCIGARGEERYLASVDVTTGRLLVVTQLDPAPEQVTTIAAGDLLVVKMTSSTGAQLKAYRAGQLEWTQPLENASVACSQVGEHIGCNNENGYTILNTADGAVTVAWTALDDGHVFQLATNGYAITSASSESQAYLFDFKGTNTATAQTFHVPAFPARVQGVFYSLEQLSQPVPVVAVNADGAVIAGRHEGELVFVGSGSRTSGEILAVNADGSKVLFSHGDEVRLSDGSGAGQGRIIGATGSQVSVVDGLITAKRADGSYELYRLVG